MSLELVVPVEEFNNDLDRYLETLDLSAALFYSANKLDDHVTKEGKIAFSAHGNNAYKHFTDIGRDLLRHILYMSNMSDKWNIDFYHWDGQINIWQKYYPGNKYTLGVIDNRTGNIFEEFTEAMGLLFSFDFDDNLWGDDHESRNNQEEIGN